MEVTNEIVTAKMGVTNQIVTQWCVWVMCQSSEIYHSGMHG